MKRVNTDDLSTKDNAYYSLLLTAAQYKKCEPIASDSIINIAVEYYTNHFDRDKLTRALMYKGGILTDLNFKKLALESYKEAEKIADTTDYLTMGLLNFRFGELYQKNFIKNDEHIERYKLALKYFKKANQKTFENNARIAIGQLYTTRNYDSAYLYLNQALENVKKSNDKQQIASSSLLLSKFYDYHNINIKQAKDLALIASQNCQGNDILSHLSMLYSKLGIIDSAYYFSKQCTQYQTAVDAMRYHMMREEISKAKNDYKAAYNSSKISEHLADSIVNAGKSEEYYAIDKEFDNTIANERAKRLKQANLISYYTILTVILCFTIIAIYWYLILKRKKRVLSDNKKLIDRLQSEIKLQQSATKDVLSRNLKTIQNLNQTIEAKIELEKSLKEIISDRISITCQLMNIKYKFEERPDKFFKQFDEIILINKKSKRECDNIIKIANYLNSCVIDYIATLNTKLSYSDLLLLSLICLEFSNIEMKVFLNSPNMEAMYATRYRLAKKLQTSSLETYIDNVKKTIFMNGKLNNPTLQNLL